MTFATSQRTANISANSTDGRSVQLASMPREIIERAAEASTFYKALGDRTRLEILYLISSNEHSRVSANALATALQISAPTITHHMKKLVGAQLVHREQQGKWAYFSIEKTHVGTVSKIFAQRTK